MIYTLVGTHKQIRERANKELAALGKATRYIYGEHVGELESLINAISLFGDVLVIHCIQLGDGSSSKKELIRLLEAMGESLNIFIIDEPFADVHMTNKLSKVSQKLFNAKEEKIKDMSVFKLCDSFAFRDKKQAWIDFMYVRTVEPAESIQGALWWKFQQVWGGVKEGKKSPYTLNECEQIGGDLVRASILAHRGKKDLMTEPERIVLTL